LCCRRRKIHLQTSSLTQKLRLLFEMNSEQAVNWLHIEEHQDTFIITFNPKNHIKACTYAVMLLGVPLLFNPEPSMRKLEDKNSKPDTTCQKVQYIKPVNQRTIGQTRGCMVIIVGTPETANKILLKGIYVLGLKIKASKCKCNPTRCTKCQHYGYLIKDFTATQDKVPFYTVYHVMPTPMPVGTVTAPPSSENVKNSTRDIRKCYSLLSHSRRMDKS